MMPTHEPSHLAGRADVVPQSAHLVGDQHLFGKTDTKDTNALGKLIERFPSVVELIGDVLIADDRTRDQLREQGYIGTEGDNVLLHRRIAAIYVDRVGHRLEGVEADADRQGDLQARDVQERQIAERIGEESRVFEETQKTEVDAYRQDEEDLRLLLVRLAVFVDEVAAGIVDDGGKDHQGDIYRLAPAVENEVDDKEQEVAPFARTYVIEYQHDRQIHEQE